MIDADLVPQGRIRPLRRAEYDRLVESGAFADEAVELLYGMLVSMSPQKARHAKPIRELTKLLAQAIGDRAKVNVQLPLALSDESEPEPDLALVPPGDYDDQHPTTAYLVIESADTSLADDRAIKGRLYAECGIPEYWIVDIRNRRLERYLAPVGGAYTHLSYFAPGDTLAPSRFPDIVVRVEDILPREVQSA